MWFQVAALKVCTVSDLLLQGEWSQTRKCFNHFFYSIDLKLFKHFSGFFKYRNSTLDSSISSETHAWKPSRVFYCTESLLVMLYLLPPNFGVLWTYYCPLSAPRLSFRLLSFSQVSVLKRTGRVLQQLKMQIFSVCHAFVEPSFKTPFRIFSILSYFLNRFFRVSTISPTLFIFFSKSDQFVVFGTISILKSIRLTRITFL